MKSFRQIAWVLAVLVPLGLSLNTALAANALPGVGQVAYDESANTLTLTIPYHGRNPYRVLWLNAPKRLVVDIEGLVITSKRRLVIGGGIVNEIRAARFTRKTTRVVFDLAQAADLRTVTDGASQTLQLTVYPRGAHPANVPAQISITPHHAPTPHHTKAPIAVVPTPVPYARITPVPLTPPSELPSTAPSFVPLPQASGSAPPMVAPSPSPEVTPAPEAAPEAFKVFGSRLYGGSEMPLSLTETYAAGNSNSSVSAINFGGVFGWDQMFTDNLGISLSGKAMSYKLQDQANQTAGFQTSHVRNDYQGTLGIRGRLGLPFGFEIMAQPGFMVRDMMVNSTVATQDASGAFTNSQSLYLDDFLYSGYLGYGPAVSAGLGWHVWGPLTLAGTFDYDYLLAGSMTSSSVTSIFPMSGMVYGGEARLEFGWFGLTAGYNMTNWSGAGGNLNQNWGGPYVKLNVIY